MDNRGLSMVEMVITIAIMAVLAGLAGTSMTAINTARAQGAAITLNSKISAAKTKAKAMQKTNADMYYGIKIYKGDGTIDEKIHFASGEYNPKTGAFTVALNDGMADDVGISSRIILRYTGVADDGRLVSAVDLDSSTPVYIYFNKRGECISGAGEYSFVKTSGIISSVTVVRKNGSHQYK